MPSQGIVRGTHHLTFCVGDAQEDYDFHVRLLGLKSVKKTVLFDGEIPIYHLYYERLAFRHPCGIEYALVGDPDSDPREPYGVRVPAEHAIRGAYGTTTSVREQGPMDYFVRNGMHGEPLPDEGEHHQYRIGTADGFGRMLELVEEPDLHQGTWHFGEGTIHHHAFDAVSAENQEAVKDHLVGLGFTDVSEAKDRGYFFSMYCRSPGGLLVELAYPAPDGFLIDEAADELGTHMCVPPHWEHRRAEISQLEPIETEEQVVS